jgi:ankyrin repeat protein
MKVTRRLWFSILLGLLSLFSVTSARNASNLTSPPAFQCAFQPDGYFYPKDTLPPEFAELDHLTLGENAGKDEPSHRPGVYDRSGHRLEFAKFSRIAPFEFTTANVNGASYTFNGSFHFVCLLEEEARKFKDAVFLEGKLVKVESGKQTAETSVEFLYTPRLRGTKDDINDVYPSGRTELIYAVLERDPTRVRALLAKGANPNIRGSAACKTALMNAIEYLDIEKSRTIVRMLLDAGAEPNPKDCQGMSALMHAAFSFEDKNGSLVNMLVKAGADVNAADNDGTTVLMHTIGGATQVDALTKNVITVIKAGAQVNARNSFGATALSFAEEDDSKRIIELLKRAGAKPD